MERQKIITIRFKNEIEKNELPLFRGAIISSINNKNILFHNHTEDSFRYSYPLVQYKRINNCAAIVAIGEGTNAIGEFFTSCNFNIHLGEKKMMLEIDSLKANNILVQEWDNTFHYHLRKWLPLNQENYKKYMETDGFIEKCSILEKTLTGNILSFAKGIDIHFEKQIITKITQISEPYQVTYKGIKMMSFDVEFKSNVSLPDFIGLGKGVSLGFGMLKKVKDEK